jgi:hypothetical protein
MADPLGALGVPWGWLLPGWAPEAAQKVRTSAAKSRHQTGCMTQLSRKRGLKNCVVAESQKRGHLIFHLPYHASLALSGISKWPLVVSGGNSE